MRVLIVDDDADLRESLRSCLESAGFSVDVAETGTKGSFMGRTVKYDVVLLDFFLPDRTGSAVCTELRAAGKNMPILAMSVQGDVPTKVELLELGADDHLTKPFSLHELLARVRALLRRPPELQADILQCEHVVLDAVRHRVTVSGQDVYFTRKEFALLEYMLRHKGMVVTRSMLFEHVWDDAVDPFSNTIETHIRSLRKKIEIPKTHRLIHTMPGRGYILDTRR